MDIDLDPSVDPDDGDLPIVDQASNSSLGSSKVGGDFRDVEQPLVDFVPALRTLPSYCSFLSVHSSISRVALLAVQRHRMVFSGAGRL